MSAVGTARIVTSIVLDSPSSHSPMNRLVVADWPNVRSLDSDRRSMTASVASSPVFSIVIETVPVSPTGTSEETDVISNSASGEAACVPVAPVALEAPARALLRSAPALVAPDGDGPLDEVPDGVSEPVPVLVAPAAPDGVPEVAPAPEDRDRNSRAVSDEVALDGSPSDALAVGEDSVADGELSPPPWELRVVWGDASKADAAPAVVAFSVEPPSEAPVEVSIDVADSPLDAFVDAAVESSLAVCSESVTPPAVSPSVALETPTPPRTPATLPWMMSKPTSNTAVVDRFIEMVSVNDPTAGSKMVDDCHYEPILLFVLSY